MLKYCYDCKELTPTVSMTPHPVFSGFPFSILTAGHFSCGKNYYTERKEQDFYLLLITLRGEGEISYLSNTFSLSENTAVLINCQDVYKRQAFIDTSFKPFISSVSFSFHKR